jgi:uncharacterized protein
VKVHPQAKTTRIAEKIGEAYKLHLAAPPVDGKANEACVRFFAELAGVSRSRVRIISGLTNRLKLVEIDGIAQEFIEGKLRS